MGRIDMLTGRGGRVAGFVAAVCCLVVLALFAPGQAAAQDYDSMMPEQLAKELSAEVVAEQSPDMDVIAGATASAGAFSRQWKRR